MALAALVAAAPTARAQERGATALAEDIAGLGTTARVLVIGAHPDDEDTQLIAWLAKGHHVETAYLSLTRGDGGQNLIGNELGEELGVIRTEELLAARRIDGAHQYFTRAYDFGFSKSAEETFKHWPHDSVLKDVVTVIRSFRPHVIISDWTGTRADGHGHHEAAGILAREAFDAAADSVRFPATSTGSLAPWATAKFYVSTAYRGTNPTVRFDVGLYDPILGHTYTEIAALSRSQHLSQGMGQIARRGSVMDGARLEASRVSTVTPGMQERSIFDGIDTSLARFRSLPLAPPQRAALDSLPMALAAAHEHPDLINPSRMVPLLETVSNLEQRLRPACDSCSGLARDFARSRALLMRRSAEAGSDAEGLLFEAIAPREFLAAPDSIGLVLSSYAGDSLEARDTMWWVGSPEQRLSMPWWLQLPRNGDMFTEGAQNVATAEDQLAPSRALPDRIQHSEPVIDYRDWRPFYRYADPAYGERDRPLSIVPTISVLLTSETQYARANTPVDRKIRVNVRSGVVESRSVAVTLTLPPGLTADSATRHVTLGPQASADVDFRVRGTIPAGVHAISAVAKTQDGSFTQGYIPIEYEHIRPQHYYRPAKINLEAVNVTVPSTLRVGYIPGVGDNVAPMLEQLGIPLTILDAANLPQTDLSKFTTIVIGTRAFATNTALVAHNNLLLNFARNGGTLVEQYGQNEMAQPGIMPYPISLGRPADRVTEEDSPVEITDAASPLLNTPNKITQADFANWVQERALYMPSTFDPHYKTMISMHDAGEKSNASAILMTPLGKGTFIYTTISFFRQLPAGNPGAARLFVNLLSAKQ